MTIMKRPLFHAKPKGPTYGFDVKITKFAVHRYDSKLLPKPAAGFTKTFGSALYEALRKIQKREGIPASGDVGQATWDVLWKYLDAYRRAQYLAWKLPVIPIPKPPVEPTQSFASLHESLWEAYSIGRNMGLSDLGTYNRASRLPGGGPSDHAVYPAYAFDLGISPHNGYDNETGRRFFQMMTKRTEIKYVILGNRIWSSSQGLRSYTSGGHENHVHASGRR